MINIIVQDYLSFGERKIWCPRLFAIQAQDHHDDTPPEVSAMSGQIATLFVRPDDAPLTTTDDTDVPMDEMAVCRGRALVYRQGR